MINSSQFNKFDTFACQKIASPPPLNTPLFVSTFSGYVALFCFYRIFVEIKSGRRGGRRLKIITISNDWKIAAIKIYSIVTIVLLLLLLLINKRILYKFFVILVCLSPLFA